MHRIILVDTQMTDVLRLKRQIPWRDMDMEVSAAFDNSLEALHHLETDSAELLFTNICMPHLSGFSLCKRAQALHPRLLTVFLSGYEDYEYAKQAIQLNAAGFVYKPALAQELPPLLKRLQGQMAAVPAAPAHTRSSTCSSKKRGGNKKLIDDIKLYSEAHLGERITMPQLARRFSFSPNHLGLLFKAETGENYGDYLLRRRMQGAGQLLHDTHLRIYEIAGSVGYRNVSSFDRQFKAFFGVAPGAFRAQQSQP